MVNLCARVSLLCGQACTVGCVGRVCIGLFTTSCDHFITASLRLCCIICACGRCDCLFACVTLVWLKLLLLLMVFVGSVLLSMVLVDLFMAQEKKNTVYRVKSLQS